VFNKEFKQNKKVNHKHKIVLQSKEKIKIKKEQIFHFCFLSIIIEDKFERFDDFFGLFFCLLFL
jgi:hypothetical protein